MSREGRAAFITGAARGAGAGARRTPRTGKVKIIRIDICEDIASPDSLRHTGRL